MWDDPELRQLTNNDTLAALPDHRIATGSWPLCLAIRAAAPQPDVFFDWVRCLAPGMAQVTAGNISSQRKRELRERRSVRHEGGEGSPLR